MEEHQAGNCSKPVYASTIWGTCLDNLGSFSRTPNYPYRGRYAKIARFDNLSELFVPVHVQILSELSLKASIRKYLSELLFRPLKKPRKITKNRI